MPARECLACAALAREVIDRGPRANWPAVHDENQLGEGSRPRLASEDNVKGQMRFMIGLVASLWALIASSVTMAAEQDLTGRYTMEGTSLRPNSRPYVGECELKRNDSVYEVKCINTHSGDKYVGKGIQRGDLFSLYLGEYLLVYRVSPAGRLDGNWVHVRSNDYGQETLTPK